MTPPKPAWTNEVAPTFEGVAGQVWEFAPPADSDDPRLATTIPGSYLIYAPAAHPFWAWHTLVGVNLTVELPGVEPPQRQYPEAEYELMEWALHPDTPPPDPRQSPTIGDMVLMEPPDIVQQFHGTGDEGAAELLSLCARACSTGLLVPDSDYRGLWEKTVKATAEHYQPGGHAL